MLAALEKGGVPVDRHLAASHLDNFRLDDLDRFVPASCVFSFYDRIVRYETGPELPPEIVDAYLIENMGKWGEYIGSFQHLHEACLAATKLEARNLSFENLSLTILGASTVLHDRFDCHGYLEKSWIEIMVARLMLDGLRLAGGANWAPDALSVSGDTVGAMGDLLSNSQTCIRTNRSGLSMVFPTSFLTADMRTNGSEQSALRYQPTFDGSAAAWIEYIIDAAYDEHPPTLKWLARTAGLSPRTIQRRLSDEGLSFSNIVDNWRMRTAIRLAADSRLTVQEMSERTRYADVPHFVRAFKRWTGVTPGRFRDGLKPSFAM